MLCPYREFKECLVEQCPSCNYETVTKKVMAGRKPPYMSDEEAMRIGCIWENTKTTYKFVSCKLVDNNVPLPDVNKQVVNTSMKLLPVMVYTHITYLIRKKNSSLNGKKLRISQTECGIGVWTMAYVSVQVHAIRVTSKFLKSIFRIRKMKTLKTSLSMILIYC